MTGTGSSKKGNSKGKRRDPHAGRSRGSTKQTGHAGARKIRLSVLEKALHTPYLNQKAESMRRRSEREAPRG